jgi:transcriptional regulator with XRE-family HTH domain
MAIEKHALGAAIKRVRMARGLTQVELAAAAGLSKGGKSIALVEQGKRFVSVDTLNALAGALDIPPACLAILGSKTIGKNKAATEFMKSLQNLVSTVVVADEELRSQENGGRNKKVPGKKPAKILRRVPKWAMALTRVG